MLAQFLDLIEQKQKSMLINNELLRDVLWSEKDQKSLLDYME
jgi:hypothetical protein